MRRILRAISLVMYYGFARFLPTSYLPGGGIAKVIRRSLCRNLFRECGKSSNIEHMAYFNSGQDIVLGDDSDLGVNCQIYGHVVIGKHVMMGPDVTIFSRNHNFSDIQIPMNKQGFSERLVPIIEDDVWIGAKVIILPGVRIGSGSVVGAGSVVTKDVPNYAIVGGNPAKVIKFRSTPPLAESAMHQRGD